MNWEFQNEHCIEKLNNIIYKMKRIHYIYLSLLSVFTLVGCGSLAGGYSLSGSSIEPDWDNLYVATFINRASLQNPTLSQDLTISIQDVFRNRTKLTLNDNENSDLVIEGEIVGYDVTSQSIKSDDIAAENRLTISVKIDYINAKDESKSFQRTFSAYYVYPGNQMLTDAESTIVPEIITSIRDQVFAAIAQDW